MRLQTKLRCNPPINFLGSLETPKNFILIQRYKKKNKVKVLMLNMKAKTYLVAKAQEELNELIIPLSLTYEKNNYTVTILSNECPNHYKEHLNVSRKLLRLLKYGLASSSV